MTIDTITDAANNTASAVLAGIEIAGPQALTSERFHTQLVPAGATVQIIDAEALEEKLADRPRRKTGIVHLHTAASFVDYLTKHELPETEVWADESRKGLVAVVNAHEDAEGGAGHGDHRAVLELTFTDAWKAWTGLDKKWLTQQQFAEHIEDNTPDIVDPDAATMLEIAESFQASMSADFKRAERLHNGVVTFHYEETQNARAGQAGDLEIPTQFLLSLAPFTGSEPIQVVARFRYRIREGNLSLSFALLNTEDILAAAYRELVETVNAGIDAPVFAGRPA